MGLTGGKPGADILADKKGLDRLQAEAKALGAPTSLRGAQPTEHLIRRNGAEAAVAYQRVVEGLRTVRNAVDRLPQADQVAFTDRMERGIRQPTPELQAVADTLRDTLDGWTRTIQGMGTAGDNLIAGAGAETLVGSGDGGNDIMFGGPGFDAMFAGTGNDTFVAATGGALMTAGPGKDLFIFVNGAVGSANTIFNFTQGQDYAAMFGYGANAVSNALGGAVVSGGSTTITLADNTRITFANITSLRSTDFL